MDIILLQKVDNLGDLGDKVNVKSGFGRNFLIPSGRAVAATADNIKAFEARRAELEKEAAATLATAEQRKQTLFGSIGTADIAKAVSEAVTGLERKEVLLSDGAFRIAGEYDVELRLHADVNATLKLTIVPEE